MTLFFRNRTASARRKDEALALTLQARAILAVDDDTVVSVNEHTCGEPGCGGAQTVILVMRPRKPTTAIKIDKTIETVTQADLAAALAPSAAGGGAAASRRK